MRKPVLVLTAFLACLAPHEAEAHPLGNFSVNRWAAIRADERTIRVDYVVDFAEIPTFQESPAIDTDGDGRESAEEVRAFAAARAATFVAGLDLTLAGNRLPLAVVSSALEFSPGAGGLQTMKLTARYQCEIGGASSRDAALPGRDPLSEGGARVALRDRNFAERAGWREMIAFGEGDAAIVEATVPAADLSRALSAYPADLILSPPRVAEAEFRILVGSAAARGRASGTASVNPSLEDVPSGGRRPVADGLTNLMEPVSSSFGPGVLFAAFAGAFFWGGAHALSPGHGKTVVAAYLVGQRGAPIHAVWLGLIVTLTHTAGVFALGASTLLLSRWFVPEALYPWLGFASGLTVLGMGVGLLYRRLHGGDGHTHGPGGHSHGSDGHAHTLADPLSPRGLVALGVSGGIVPCPSALVVLLSAIAFHRLLFGMALIVAFSVGLASVLVAVGLLMVYARHLFDHFDGRGVLAARLGLVSAVSVALLGAGIALKSVPPALVAAVAQAALPSPGSGLGAGLGVLGLGLLFGLKHATEADHLAAVSNIVSEKGDLRQALWTGGLWGAGHTVSIAIAGVFVLGLHLVIPGSVARWLEFGVALMIIALGGTALARALGNRADLHLHSHSHHDRRHAHLHFHGRGRNHRSAPGGAADATFHSHEVHDLGNVGVKPLLVGMMHGLAGSAALTLLVLAQIPSPGLGFAYLLVFGLGSIGGMVLMSLAISVPFAATLSRPGLNRTIRVASGILSVAFGIFYAYSQAVG